MCKLTWSMLTVQEKGNFKNVLRLFPTKAATDEYNLTRLVETGRLVARMPSTDNCATASTASSDDAKGLEKILYLSIGARVMLRSNLATQYGLVNGALCTGFGCFISINWGRQRFFDKENSSCLEGKEEMQVGRAINQIDVASEEMPMPMERDVQEQVVAKTLEKEEQLFEVSRALSVLASASSVSGKYENFLGLVNKEGSASRNSTGIAEYACVAGLYTAVTILMG
ncbi:hypothetical protein GIB67_035956 [Kingdonia uniflora]|uniref:ATP-dependent DNA helicase n=1 Tax=Kingdonia uniflora TaxID=39325 RepID=A0A7J7N0P7_9MAGN|nr:hypothetical protein GIB67_035956 [Kingdonia uniflora]